MSRSLWLGCAAALALSQSSASLIAQETPAAVAETPAAAEGTPAREPAAMAALERMGVTLRGLQSFGLHLDTTSEEVLSTGQKIQFAGTVDYALRRPNKLRIDAASDRISRTIVYDGSTFTLFSPRIGYYASFPAPADIRSTLVAARDRLGLELPISDLFTWGTDTTVSGRVTAALSLGPETIGGQACDHYAMRQEGVDWQIWIRQGEQALPCKIVITTTNDPSMPQFSAVFNWRLDQTFGDDAFTFVPPAGARKINFATFGESQAAN